MVAEFSSAVGGMEEEGEIAASSLEDAAGNDWDGLHRQLSVLGLADMASKAQLLQSLSSFLSCVATTMSFSTEVNALSASVGASAIFLGHKEVAQLHELVVGELKDRTDFLSALDWISNEQMDEGADGDFSRVLNVKIVSQTLRCCIRILPLVDCFDKNASLASTKVLDGILQQLCHPTQLFHLLGLKASEDMHSRRYQTAQGDEGGTYLENTESHETCMANSLDMDSQHLKELIFAILEVYLDELLLHPDLTARLLRSREDPCRSLAQDQVTCRVKHTEASLEAAFVHVLLSLHPGALRQVTPGSSRKGFLVENLSLPAGLILLEKFGNDGVPPFYIAHVVSLLAGILNDATPVGCGQVDDLSRTRRTLVKNCWAGGVDWSYCSQELLPNFDFKDDHFPTTSSPSETALNFASAILEQTIVLYSRISYAPDTCADRTGSSRCQTLEKSLLEFYLSKYTPLLDVFGGSSELNTIDGVSGADIGIGHVNLYRDDCQCCLTGALDTESDYPLCSGTTGFAGEFVHQSLGAGFYCVERRNNVVFDKEDVKDSSALVVALLQLMSCALKCIAREVYRSTWLPDAFGDQVLDAQATLSSDSNETDFDKILQCVGLYLSLCLPSATGLFSTYHEQRYGKAGEDDGGSSLTAWAQVSLNILVGQTIVFFSNILGREVRRGAPDEILEEYFHLVESLVALLLALDERNDSRKSTPECGLICNCALCDDICRTSVEVSGYGKCIRCSSFENDVQQLPKSDSTSSYLEEMVLSLRGMLQYLSERQRPMPEFFLCFIFKQLSKRDALSLMAMAFGSCLHNHLDVLQPITRRTELFQSEGLLTEVLHLALSEPTKPCSLFTFMIYMVDILQDHLSITETLSTSEVAEPISHLERIAYSLTLASQLVVFERRMFVRNGMELFISFISKMSQGIERVLTEGIAAAHWLSDHCKTIPEEEWHKLAGAWDSMGTSTGNGRCCGGEEWNVTGNLGKCNIFLRQVDMLRNAVEELAGSVDSSLDCELTPLLEKGRIFFAALSELLAGQKLPEYQWSLYLSEQNQHLSLGTEPGSHLPANSLDVGIGCDHVDGHQNEFAGRAMQELKECEKTPASDVIPVGDQTFQIEKVSCSEDLSAPISDHLAGQEEVIMTKSSKGSIFSTAELILSSAAITVERRLTRSATSLITQKSDTQDDGLGSEKAQPIPQERKHCSASTSAIIKRLLQKKSSSRGKSTGSYQICSKRPDEVETRSGQELASCDFIDDVVTDVDVPASTSSNLFVDSLNKQDPSSDNFDDLKDFIVSKKGRDYSVWLKRRHKVRRRLYSKNFFKRLQEKKELLLLLDI